jgi:uncharacterized protein (TIGR01777 family)
MNVLVTGSTGLVGSALVPFLVNGGHHVTRLVRSRPSTLERAAVWDPEKGEIDAAALADQDAVIHLAGENIAGGRWNAERKARIRNSRVQGTRLLGEALARLTQPPKVFLSASAIGYYGSRGDEVMREDSYPGTDFLADVCRDWEAAAALAQDKGIRVVFMRIGVILSAQGGALAKMLTPFKMGVGGRVGNGRQYLSWIALDDVVAGIHHCWMTESLQGPVNLVAPNPVTNLEFTKTLGRVLGRPTIMPLPAFAARLMFGEMADALLLSSTRVAPGRLLATHYAFRFPQLAEALRHLLGKPAEGPPPITESHE